MDDIGAEQGAPLVGDAPFGAGGLGMADGIALLLYELFQLVELRIGLLTAGGDGDGGQQDDGEDFFHDDFLCFKGFPLVVLFRGVAVLRADGCPASVRLQGGTGPDD